jgi:hypothetical protein
MWDGIWQRKLSVCSAGGQSDERGFYHRGCVRISASTLRHATSADTQHHLPPFAKSKQTVGRPLVSGDAREINSRADSGGGAEITQEVCRRRADCARPFASALLSRGTCEMENFSERANFWQVQCRE